MKTKPLDNTFFLVAIVGAIVCGFLTYFGRLSPSWGFTLTLMFIIFIIASLVSVSPTQEDLE